MTRPIRAVKEEIRILGLDTCNFALTVGVVTRGGLYMDGVIPIPTSPKKPKNTMRERARSIVKSGYFPELRAIMLHNPDRERDSRLLERMTTLPTIGISKDEPRHSRGYRVFDGNLGRLWVDTRLEQATVTKTLMATWTFGSLPEPLRVAHLIASLDFRDISG